MQSPGLIHRAMLKLGLDELQWAQMEEEERWAFFRRMGLLTPGLLVPLTPSGDMDAPWQVRDQLGGGVVTVNIAALGWASGMGPQVASAIGADGLLWRMESTKNITVPDDNTWYTLEVSRIEEQVELGTLSLSSGSSTILGTGTEFTRFSGKTSSGFGRGTKIRIAPADSSSGNAGTMEIDEVVSDTEIKMVSNVPGGTETILKFYVAGDYATTPPTDPDIHLFERVRVARVSRRRSPSAGAFVLADVCWNSGTMSAVAIIDRRDQNLARQARTWGPVVPWPVQELTVTCPGFVLAVRQDEVYTVITSDNGHFMAGDGLGGQLTVIQDNALITVWGRALGETAWAVVAASVDPNGAAPVLLELPKATGFTHICFYVQSASVYQTRSTDNGATWSAPSLVWDPTINDPNDEIRGLTGLLLQSDRILLEAVYYDDSAAAGAGQQKIIGIRSATYGDTWDLNGGGGYAAVALSTTGPTVYYDVDHPVLAQREDGAIILAYDIYTPGGSSIPEQVGTRRSTDDGASWGLSIGFQGVIVNPTGITLYRPALWIDPCSGAALLIVQAWQDSVKTAHLWGIVLGVSNTMPSNTLRIGTVISFTAGLGLTPYYVHPVLFQGIDGVVWLSYYGEGGKIVTTPLQIQYTHGRSGMVRD